MRKAAVLPLLLLALLSVGATAAEAKIPKRFFGIVPQTVLSDRDTSRMRRGGVDSVRVPVQWSGIQPSRTGGFNWANLDRTVRLAAQDRHGDLPVDL